MADFDREEIAAVLDDFAKKVIQQARRNLTIFSGNKTRALHKSFRRDLNVFKDIINVVIYGEDYWKYQNYGVGGTVSSPIGLKADSTGHRFRFISKKGKTGLKGMPPPGAFKTDKINRPVSDSRAFATAVKIFKHGFKPTEFFTRPFDTAFKKLVKDVDKAYGLDVEKFIKKKLKKSK